MQSPWPAEIIGVRILDDHHIARAVLDKGTSITPHHLAFTFIHLPHTRMLENAVLA